MSRIGMTACSLSSAGTSSHISQYTCDCEYVWMYEYKYAFHFFKNKIIENDVLLNDIGSISAEASDFECDVTHDDVKAADKDNALCLALSQLVSEFSK